MVALVLSSKVRVKTSKLLKMKEVLFFLFTGLVIGAITIQAQESAPQIQEEESAAVSLEAYSDDFQENFFEALKQKGIENYDKSINLFLECKRLDANNRVIDHELAKVYLEDKQYPLAEDHAIIAVNAEPENLWYLNTLVRIVQIQSASFNAALGLIPAENPKLKENLALIYYQQGNYVAAQDALNDAKNSTFTADLSYKIEREIEKIKARRTSVSFSTTTSDSNEREQNPMEAYKARIRGLIATPSLASSGVLQQISEEALETYPSQPFFYYANGYALNKVGKHRAAIDILEAALDYMLDDISLSNKIYQELSDAYKAMNNSVKSNMYLRKIKAGF